MTFPGFPDDSSDQVQIPEQFFHQALYKIDDLDELRLTLYIFWRLDRKEGDFRYLRFSDLSRDTMLVNTIGKNRSNAKVALREALQKATERGTLIQADIAPKAKGDKVICMNSPKNRTMIKSIDRGEWRVPARTEQDAETVSEHPNIYQLYEANIGPLTPMVADALRDAEQTYHPNWIVDAFRIAAERKKRNWHYVEAILQRWQEGGRDDRKDQPARRNTQEARRRYSDWEK